MTLGDFLRGVGPGPWNCSTMAADWCMVLGWPDFAARWRAITDPAECDAVAADGLAHLWREGIGDALPAAAEPYQAGDIAVISVHGLEAGAICTGDKWALRGPRGVTCLRLRPENIVQAWRPGRG